MLQHRREIPESVNIDTLLRKTRKVGILFMYLFDNVSVLLEMRGGDEESCQYQFCKK
jgi:hypothetical protein